MKGSLVLGRVAGIKIQVHWSFTLLLLWVLFSSLRQGGGAPSALFSMGLVLVLFLCVVLHELGHALMARRFGITTRSITLLPIGGVAALEKMPEKPKEELAVALAGPAVNVLIALILFLLIPLRDYSGFTPDQWESFLSQPSWASFLVYLLLANSMLVAFNLIPAFPMDGGRVLRALLGFYFHARGPRRSQPGSDRRYPLYSCCSGCSSTLFWSSLPFSCTSEPMRKTRWYNRKTV